MATRDPYAAGPPKFGAPSAPPQGGGGMRNGMQMSPEELDKLLAQGYTVYEDGSVAPPEGPAPAGGEALPPPPEMAAEAATWDNPIFTPHMSIRNPQPAAADPIADMMKQQKRFMDGEQAKADVMVSASPLPTPQYTQADETMKPGGGPQSMMQSRMAKRMGQQPLPPRGGRRA